MAAVAGLLFLLAALINAIHGEENINQNLIKGDTVIFQLPMEATFCVISRSIGEENLVLWNTSDPSPVNSMLPEDLKKRLHVVTWGPIVIHHLTHSDSGLYREECWTDGNVTHQQNIDVNVCDVNNDPGLWLTVSTGETVDLPCEGAGASLTVQWFRSEDLKKKDSPWTRLFVDNNRSLNPRMKHLEGRVQLVRNHSSLRISNLTRGDFLGPHYYCLVMDGQRCVRSNKIIMFPDAEYVHLSVGEEAVLPCFDTDLYGPPTHWKRNHVGKLKTFPFPPSQNHSGSFSNLNDRGQRYRNSDDPVVNDNFSLVFSSLTLFHNGVKYKCVNDQYMRSYFLLVCPESAPVTQYFSCGEDVTLGCDILHSMHMQTVWIRQDGAMIGPYYPDGEIHQINESFKGRVNVSYPYPTLVLSNLTSEDSGEYRCMVFDRKCKSTTKTILIYEHCFSIDSAVRATLMSCGLLGLICAVATVMVRTRKRAGIRDIDT